MKFCLPALCLRVTGCLGLPDLPDLASGNPDMVTDASPSADSTETPDASSDAAPSVDAGDGADANSTPRPTWVQITAGKQHACALTDDHHIYCWGHYANGRLGLGGVTTPQLMPAPVGRPTTQWDAVAAGAEHTCAVGDGAVYCWGNNANGRLAIDASDANSPTLTTLNIMLAAGTPGVIGVGVAHSCALQDSGLPRCWGLTADGRIGDGNGVVNNISMHSIALGEKFGCGVSTTDKSVVCWGSLPPAVNASTSTPAVSGVHKALSVGVDHGCAVATDDGTVWCFGSNMRSGTATGLVSKLGHSTSGAQQLPASVDGISGATAVAAGWDHTCAIYGDPLRISCWGANDNGATGQSGQSGRQAPLDVVVEEELAGLTAIAAGSRFTCAIAAGEIYCWGANNLGQLGRGDKLDSHIPRPVQLP